MRIATYNVEWFASLFDGDDQLYDDDGWSVRYGVTRADQTAAIAHVLRALDADAVMIIEAPDQGRRHSTVTALSGFADRFGLRTSDVLIGFGNDTQQEIALLYDPAQLTVRHDPQCSIAAPRFDGTFPVRHMPEAEIEQMIFSKPPLEVTVKAASGYGFHLIGAHLKSMAPHGATSPAEVLQIGMANRRKQLAQAQWLRARIKTHLTAATPLMVVGDMNDGPGLDNFEALFDRSTVEILLGEDGPEALFDPHAKRALAQRIGAQPSTARFWIKQDKRYLQALLDYIMVSADIREKDARWRIWHPMDDPGCWQDPALRDALITASDHFPVTIDFDAT